jgi:hypothetical protein
MSPNNTEPATCVVWIVGGRIRGNEPRTWRKSVVWAPMACKRGSLVVKIQGSRRCVAVRSWEVVGVGNLEDRRYLAAGLTVVVGGAGGIS